jgi:hypothetical protein
VKGLNFGEDISLSRSKRTKLIAFCRYLLRQSRKLVKSTPRGREALNELRNRREPSLTLKSGLITRRGRNTGTQALARLERKGGRSNRSVYSDG